MPVADPGFPRVGGGNSRGGMERQPKMLSTFGENCMKMENSWPLGDGWLTAPGPPLDRPLNTCTFYHQKVERINTIFFIPV